ncbi:MAG: hypothetical protein HY318_12015 [Armatimonadetes bacterium]|nr:hypothetical protein [Armatimonadota bacterium]
MVRFELLLPLCYNDGRPVDKHKFRETRDELIERFGAVSTDSVIVSGHWLYKGTLYEDKLIRIRIDAVESEEVRQFITQYKEILKERFEQFDVYITAQQIEVL